MSGTVLWDVDTQVDFVLPDGKLYVPGAEQVVPAMRQLVEAARAAGVVHVASADDHELTDAEISSSVSSWSSADATCTTPAPRAAWTSRLISGTTCSAPGT